MKVAFSLPPLVPVFPAAAPPLFAAASGGKGSDTIEELNKLARIYIDPALVSDPGFYDYSLVVRDESYAPLYVLFNGTNEER